MEKATDLRVAFDQLSVSFLSSFKAMKLRMNDNEIFTEVHDFLTLHATLCLQVMAALSLDVDGNEKILRSGQTRPSAKRSGCDASFEIAKTDFDLIG